MKIGVLALQGDFAKHIAMLTRLGVEWQEVRTAKDLLCINALIIPGGESTTMLRLLNDEQMFVPLQQFVHKHPAFGTCAGAILLAKEVSHPPQASLAAMDMAIARNGYGRQVDSFSKMVTTALWGDEPLELVFIRAPIITAKGGEVEVLAECEGTPVLVREGNCLAATFHPELTADLRVHQLFLKMVARALLKGKTEAVLPH